jgi:hypothetical protein
VTLCEISSSHGGEYEAQNLLGSTAVFLIECRRTFQSYVLPPSSGHRPGDGGSTYLRNVVDIQLRTRQYIPEDSEIHTVTLLETKGNSPLAALVRSCLVTRTKLQGPVKDQRNVAEFRVSCYNITNV